MLYPLPMTHALNEVKLIYSTRKFSAVLSAKKEEKKGESLIWEEKMAFSCKSDCNHCKEIRKDITPLEAEDVGAKMNKFILQ